jgi:hypothetical protein
MIQIISYGMKYEKTWPYGERPPHHHYITRRLNHLRSENIWESPSSHGVCHLAQPRNPKIPHFRTRLGGQPFFMPPSSNSGRTCWGCGTKAHRGSPDEASPHTWSFTRIDSSMHIWSLFCRMENEGLEKAIIGGWMGGNQNSYARTSICLKFKPQSQNRVRKWWTHQPTV